MEDNEEIVISGLSGRYPECNNVVEFGEALMKGLNLTTVDNRRYTTEYKNIPHQIGKLPELDKFDGAFFGFHHKQANFTDPRQRILLETVFEAILDAGYNPAELSGSKTGVFVAINSFSNLEEVRRSQASGYSVTGTGLFSASNRISYSFNFTGPSISMDTACSGSLYALSLAVQQLEVGEIENAIVSGTHLVLHPDDAAQMNHLNMLSKDGVTRPFCKSRNGIVRGESVCSILLQKRKTCRRVYASVLGCKANADGFNEQGFTLPTVATQLMLLKELYSKYKLSPQDVVYMELHATGTPAGDAVECETTWKMFGNNRKGPLLVGGVKCNTGHSESTAGLVSITKAIIAMESGIIPSTINTEPIDQSISGFQDGTLKVVTTNTKLPDGLVGINAFGLGGTNAHAVLKPNQKILKNKIDRSHRLVQVSGRTEEAVNYFLDQVERHQTDEEFLSLIDEVHKLNIKGHTFRGYTVLGEKSIREVTKGKTSDKPDKPIVFIYSGLGSQWKGMGRDLMIFKTFRETFNRCAEALLPYEVDLKNIILDETPINPDHLQNIICAITAIEVALTELLYSFNVKPDFFAGHSIGEVGCAYANGDITPEQAALMSYARAYATTQQPLPEGQMAAIGLSKEELNKMLPEEIDIACENSRDNITISGPAELTRKFVKYLQDQGIFARLVPSSNLAFHSRYILESHKHLLRFLKNVLVDPTPRSSKWISSSVPPEKMQEEWVNLNCAEYHTNNYKSKVLFDKIFESIPKNAIVIEIGPHGILQSILKRELDPKNTLLSLTSKSSEDHVQHLLSAIGRIFTCGGQPNLRKHYSDVVFPVSRGTNMLAPLIKWDHSTSWFVPYWKNESHSGQVVTVNISEESHAYLKGHNVGGSVMMPAFGYMDLVWQVYASKNLKDKSELPIVIENAKFLRVTYLPENENVEFLTNIMNETGNFEIFEGGSVVATGTIRVPQNVTEELKLSEIASKNINVQMCNRDDFYQDARFRGLIYNGVFKGIEKCDFEGTKATIEWMDNYSGFLDSLCQLNLCNEHAKNLCLPSAFKKLVIDPVAHFKEFTSNKHIEVTREPFLRKIRTKGVEITGLELKTAPMKLKTQADPLLETYEYISYNSPKNNYDFDTSLLIAIQIISQNISGVVKNINIGHILLKEDYTNEDIIRKIENIAGKLILTSLEFLAVNIKDNQTKFDCLILNENIFDKYTVKDIAEIINDECFVLYIGDLSKFDFFPIEIVFRTPSVVLLRRKLDCLPTYNIINITSYNFDWLKELKKLILNPDGKHMLLLSDVKNHSGLVGLLKCLYAEETDSKITGFLIDNTEEFSVDNQVYFEQLSKHLAINVLNNGHWGTYVHLPLEEIKNEVVSNACLLTKTLGDFSSFSWMQKPEINSKENDVINIQYVALNSMDLQLVVGKLQLSEESPTSEYDLGVEYSGTSKSKKRVMGLVYRGALCLKIRPDPFLIWDVPEQWTLQEASTIPAIYSLCYYSIVIKGSVEPGESILIQAPLNLGIVAAAISLEFNANVFMNVKTVEEKEFVNKHFPTVEVGLIDDVSFLKYIKEQCEEGLSLILHALNEDLLYKSLTLLKVGSRILDLSKTDSSQITVLDSRFFGEYSYYVVTLDIILKQNNKIKEKIQKLIIGGISSGLVKPLRANVFEDSEIDKAFRILESSESSNKILIKIPSVVRANPRIYFDPAKVYIIIGGLGGMGLELANWLITKGARKVILNSRRDIWNGYQIICLRKWSQYNNALVKIDTNDTLTEEGTLKLIQRAQNYGLVGGIYNLAMVLRDGKLIDQSSTTFEEVFGPKLKITENMDRITRKHCPEIKHFIVFSSITCGRGNVGQTNYGMANSAMEMICEERRKENLPGLAIQWGPITDVGVLAKIPKEKDFPYLIPQKIQSCFEALEKCMLRNVLIGSSCLKAENKKSLQTAIVKSPSNVVAQIMGIKNIDLIDKGAKLSQLGIDSLMLAEIKQILYRTFQIKLKLISIRNLTFEELAKMK